MDYIPSMFQLDQSKDHIELCQIISNNFPCKDQHDFIDSNHIQIRFEDEYHHHHHGHHQAHPSTPFRDGREGLITNKRRRPSSSNNDHNDDDWQENPNNENKKKKKVVHREIERQRRKEMATLYASLRSLIPLHHLKGKRSISDQMHVASNYIKELQRKNQELKDKRDRLKKKNNNYSCPLSSDTTNNNNHGSKRSRDPSESSISVRHSRAGIEVVVNTAFEQGLPLGRLLRVITEHGLNVLACVSAKVNDMFLHTIESEAVSGERNLLLPELEQKLKKLIV